MIERVAVIVPAADEQDRIAGCLRAIQRARRRLLHSGVGVDRVDVIVVLDACRDQTAAVVAAFAHADGVHAIRSTARRVGAARRHGALHAISTMAPTERLWLANTDADSIVPRDWLTRTVAAANAGAGVVLGTVIPGTELPRALRTAWLAEHHPHEGHPHVHGANLGVRADTYLAIGGWRDDLASDEDTDLARRAAEAADIQILRTASIPVVTSARMVGQAPNGFSSYLRHLRDHRPALSACAGTSRGAIHASGAQQRRPGY
jgi:glycosyltransferase involved in cell wall biosynthesis